MCFFSALYLMRGPQEKEPPTKKPLNAIKNTHEQNLISSLANDECKSRTHCFYNAA